MFTGLVEAVGSVRSIRQDFRMNRLRISADFSRLALGESIAVRGICLTVVDFGEGYFEVEASPETMRCTNLGSLKPGDHVNLERAMVLGGRMGGHWVMGHVDGVAEVSARIPQGAAVRVDLRFDRQWMRYVVPKGSIALDGVSLTVNEAGDESFSVMLIPHTQKSVSPDFLSVGQRVNVEVDVLGKYVERLMAPRMEAESRKPEASDLKKILIDNGFIR